MKEDTTFVHELSNFRDWWRMQSVMSATDMLGHRDVRGLSAIDPPLALYPRKLACCYNRCW